MAEPEGLLIEGARLASAGARDLWYRIRPAGEPSAVALARVRRRLELLLGALFAETMPLRAADGEPPPTWLARLFGRAPRHLTAAEPLAATDGRSVWLPRAIEVRGGEDEGAAIDRYRLLAVEQAMRVVLGFPRAWRDSPSRIERDLYRVAEGAAVDRQLARDLPGLVPALRAARAAALAARPASRHLAKVERAVEHLARMALAAEPHEPPPALAAIDAPEGARAWARAEARRLGAGRYRGIAPVALWGVHRPPAVADPRDSDAPRPSSPRSPVRTAVLPRRPRARRPRDDEDPTAPGMWMVRFDDPMESVEDGAGIARPTDRADSADLGDALSDLPEVTVVRTRDAPRDVLLGDAEPATRISSPPVARDATPGIAYPEWDHRRRAYRLPGAIVWPIAATDGDAAWVERVLVRRAALVRHVRRRFEGLRARRARQGRQGDGPEVDLEACVTAFADRRAGEAADDRVYAAWRPARRDVAVAILADVSASTDAWLAGGLRVVDVEKEALVILLEALHALGDRHAVLAFAGEGPRAVRVRTLKGFEEQGRAAAQRRIAALEPDGYTRVGAAIRHATALLGRERARHRLLLVLSDGKPNDVDEYAGRYGIEDTRQAMAEARLQGLTPFCLTVDRDAPTYLPQLFGPRGYTVLSRPELLPTALVAVLRSLIAN